MYIRCRGASKLVFRDLRDIRRHGPEKPGAGAPFEFDIIPHCGALFEVVWEVWDEPKDAVVKEAAVESRIHGDAVA